MCVCEWVSSVAGCASLPCRAAAIETSTGLEAKVVRTSSLRARKEDSRTENQPTTHSSSCTPQVREREKRTLGFVLYINCKQKKL